MQTSDVSLVGGTSRTYELTKALQRVAIKQWLASALVV